MSASPPSASRVPSLGPRGEGWVALQFVCLGLVAAGCLFAPSPDANGGFGTIGIIGAIIAIAGLALAGWGVAALQGGRSLTALPYPRDAGTLVETGAYRFSRHPIYGGLILVALGSSISRASLPAFVATVALAVALDLKRRREEAWLVGRYPGYPAYRTRTRALIPFLY